MMFSWNKILRKYSTSVLEQNSILNGIGISLDITTMALVNIIDQQEALILLT